MSDPVPIKLPLFGGKAAAILGCLFLGACLLCAVLVGCDRAQRTRLESVQPQRDTAHSAR